MDPIITVIPRRKRSRLSPAVIFARHHALQKGITKTNLRKTIAQKMLLRRSHQQYQQYHYFGRTNEADASATDTDVEDNDQFHSEHQHGERESNMWHNASLSNGLIQPHLVDSSHEPHCGEEEQQLYWSDVAGDKVGPEEHASEENTASYLSDDAYSQDAWWTEEIEMGSQFDENDMVNGEWLHYGEYVYEACEEEEEEDYEEEGAFCPTEEAEELDGEALNDDEITHYLETYEEAHPEWVREVKAEAEPQEAESARLQEALELVTVKVMEASDALHDDAASTTDEEHDAFDGDEESDLDEATLETIDIDADLFDELTEADGDVALHDTGAEPLLSAFFKDDLHILAA